MDKPKTYNEFAALFYVRKIKQYYGINNELAETIYKSLLDNSGSMLKGDSAGFSLCDKSGQEIMRVAQKCANKGLEALFLIGPSLTVRYRPTQRSSGGISRSSGHSIDYSGGSSNNNNNNNNNNNH